MKTTRKILGIALVIAIVCVMMISNVSAAAVTVKTIDESGNLAGSIAAPVGMPTNATGIDYLSDRAPTSKTENVDINFNELNGNLFIAFTEPDASKKVAVQNNGVNKDVTIKGQSVTLSYGNVYLGGYATKYDKGIAVKGNTASPTVELVYATNGAGHFYSVVGGTGNQICNNATSMNPNGDYTISFTVLGGNSADGTFTELAKTSDLYYFYTAEFDVDISAYSYIKLSYTWKYSGSGEAAKDPTVNGFWGTAALYNLPAATTGTTGSSSTTGSTTGTTSGGNTSGGSNAKTADSFTMTAVAALVLGAASVTALVVSKKKFF